MPFVVLRSLGVSGKLLEYAIDTLHVRKVDVNKQNMQALSFYKKFGFKIIGRSEKDDIGKE